VIVAIVEFSDWIFYQGYSNQLLKIKSKLDYFLLVHKVHKLLAQLKESLHSLKCKVTKQKKGVSVEFYDLVAVWWRREAYLSGGDVD
jgi:hypothetical protein